MRTRAAVLERVGEGLLHQPVHRELYTWRNVRPGAVDLQLGIQPRRPDLLDERVELGHVGYRLKSLVGVLAGALAQHAEEPACIGQRAPPGG